MAIEVTNSLVSSALQFCSTIVVVIGGGIAAYKAIHEMRQNLAWKKADAAKKIIDELFNDEKAVAAMTMLDWGGGRLYEVGDKKHYINRDLMLRALRLDNLHFNHEEQYVRDCFDALFIKITMIGWMVDRHLVQFDDVHEPLKYIAKKINQFSSVFFPFLSHYNYDVALLFICRFGNVPCKQT